MDELEKEIEKKKRMIQDYLRLAELFDYPRKEIDRQVDMMLEDLKKLTDKRKKK